MSKFTMMDDLNLVVRMSQWLTAQGKVTVDHFSDLLAESAREGKNPLALIGGIMDMRVKDVAVYFPSRNGHGPATISAPAESKSREGLMDGLEPDDTIKSSYIVDLKRMKRVTGANIVRAWVQLLPAHAPVTGVDIYEVLAENFRGFRLKSKIQRQALVDNVTYALRNAGILEWEKKGNHYKRSRFFKTEKVHRKGRRSMSTNRFIQAYLVGWREPHAAREEAQGQGPGVG